MGRGAVAPAVPAWQAVALVGVVRTLHGHPLRPALGDYTGDAFCMPDIDPLLVRAAKVFAGDVADGRVPSVRAIRTRLYVRQPRAKRTHTWPRLSDSR